MVTVGASYSGGQPCMDSNDGGWAQVQHVVQQARVQRPDAAEVAVAAYAGGGLVADEAVAPPVVHGAQVAASIQGLPTRKPASGIAGSWGSLALPSTIASARFGTWWPA